MKHKAVRASVEGTEYPALSGKVIQQVRLVNDEDHTALTIVFDDDTRVSFRLKARIGFSIDPELSTVTGGDIVNWNYPKYLIAAFRNRIADSRWQNYTSLR